MSGERAMMERAVLQSAIGIHNRLSSVYEVPLVNTILENHNPLVTEPGGPLRQALDLQQPSLRA